MKSFFNRYIPYSYILILFAPLFISCEQNDIESNNPLVWLPSDSDYQSNPTYLLDTTQFEIEAPPSLTSEAYQKELNDIQTAQASATKADKEKVKEWAGMTFSRWNHIARELAAKYNYAPAANAQGIYPNPDPANPLSDPRFPFANPPYVARMFAFLAVANHDALVITWQKKFHYKHKRPYELSTSIEKKGVQHENLPAYPSHDAVIAQTSAQILKQFFPGEKEYIDRLLLENEQAVYLSGESTQFGIDAGKKLGAEVAKQVIDYSKTDGMAQANNQAVFDNQVKHAAQLGIVPQWKSQEIPARPPMLPNYGQVRTWHLTKADIEKNRPKLPPKFGEQQFQKELEELQNVQKNQTREQARIANFWADGVGSYTPPGHWHRITSQTCEQKQLSVIQTASHLALVSTALMDAGIACWETKYFYCTPRPQQFGLKTSVGVPNFPAYTSGHSTFSGAAAEVLSHLFPEDSQRFRAKAQEASISRIYGLIHFRVDCDMGLEHGAFIGKKAIEKRIR